MSVAQEIGARSRVEEIVRGLHPRTARETALESLDEIFRAGTAPSPSGFTPGKLLTTDIAGPVDGVARRIAALWMPWLGKSFDQAASTGINILTPGSKSAVKMVWRNYEPVREAADAIEVFPFVTRHAPGELDPQLEVLKIDYDSDANPSFIIRDILDELVQVDEGYYLGKILFRRKGAWHRIGFFSLQDR